MSIKQDRPPYGANCSDFLKNFKVPGSNSFDAMMVSHQKNVEAFTAAQQTAADVFRGLINLNTQYWRSMFEEASSSSRALMNNNANPEEKLQQHANSVKSCADKAWHHSQEVSDMLNQSTSKVAAIYSKRFHECMNEGKDLLKSEHPSETETIKV